MAFLATEAGQYRRSGRRRVLAVALQFLDRTRVRRWCARSPTGSCPPHGEFPGAGAAGTADYVDRMLGAFTVDPPRIWAGGPYSGRHGGDAGFDEFLPLSRLEELAWRTRIEGSRGIAGARVERAGARLAGDLPRGHRGWASTSIATSRDPRRRSRSCAQLLFEHACEACYGAPEYGGNRDLAGWRAIGYAGDVQPRGWSDEEVTGA